MTPALPWILGGVGVGLILLVALLVRAMDPTRRRR